MPIAVVDQDGHDGGSVESDSNESNESRNERADGTRGGGGALNGDESRVDDRRGGAAIDYLDGATHHGEDENSQIDGPVNETIAESDPEDESDDEVSGLNEEEDEDKMHWRGMIYNETTKKFELERDNFADFDQGTAPKSSDWKKVHPRDMKEVNVVFNQGRETMMLHLVEEYDCLNRRLESLAISKDREGIFQFTFGERSRMAGVFMRELDLPYPKVAQFLATMFWGAKYSCSPGRLFQDKDINSNEYMDVSEYNRIWSLIADHGRMGEKLWEKVQRALNEDARDLFLTEPFIPRSCMIALDDDKLHLHWRTESVRNDGLYLMGMKGCQHIKANCRGFVIDTAVAAATGFPLHFSVLRQGETNSDNYDRMVKFMFHNRFAIDAAIQEALRGMIFCSDRGYWTAILIMSLLRLGATTFGTLKQAPWLPYTFNQQPPLHGRELIDGNRGRSCFTAFTRMENVFVKVMAFRSGTGPVSLAMNRDTADNEPQTFDFCFKRDDDAKWYKSATLSVKDQNLKAFPIGSVLEKNLPEDLRTQIDNHLDSLSLDQVQMLTTGDLDFVWFANRMFSYTSSSAHETLRYSGPLIQPNEDIYSAFKDVLGYGSLAHLLRADDTSNVDLKGDVNHEQNLTGPGLKEMADSMRAVDVDEDTIQECQQKASQLERRLRQARDTSELSVLLLALGLSHDGVASMDLSTMKKKLRVFASSITKYSVGSVYLYPYKDLLSAREIELELRKRVGVAAIESGTVPGPNSKPTTKNDRCLALHYLDQNPSESRTSTSENSDVRDAVIAGILAKSFLRPLDGKDRNATRLGHQNEVPYLKQFFQDSMDGNVPGLKLCDVRQCGLAMQKQRPYVRDSADAIAFEECEGEGDYFDTIRSHPVELKCRSGSGNDGSLTEAYRIQARVGQLIGLDGQRRARLKQSVYYQISSSQRDLLAELMPKKSERIQIIHHAFTYGANKTSFLVGGPHRNVLYGLIVTFEDDLLENYGKVLDYLYENGLKTFYEDAVENLPIDFMESVLLSNENLKKKYDINDAMTSFLIWRALLPTSINKSPPKYPIPPCNKLLPLDYAQWNSSKGGSDTCTRFTYNCQVILPNKKPQSYVISRLLQLEAVLFHRVSQAVTGTKKPDIYEDTIRSVRDRNNKRMSFHNSCDWLKARLLKEAHPSKKPSESASTSSNGEHYKVERAARYTNANKNSRYETNHAVLGKVGTTGVTPLGRGGKKHVKNPSMKHQEYDKRCAECEGKPARLVVKDSGKRKGASSNSEDNDKAKRPKTFTYSRHVCDLCGKNGIAWYCLGCKQTLCFDQDRTDHFRKMLRDEAKRKELSEKFPYFAELPRNDAPAHRLEIGELKGKTVYTNLSCFHYVHPDFLLRETQKGKEDRDAPPDDQLAAIAEHDSSVSSPFLRAL